MSPLIRALIFASKDQIRVEERRHGARRILADKEWMNPTSRRHFFGKLEVISQPSSRASEIPATTKE